MNNEFLTDPETQFSYMMIQNHLQCSLTLREKSVNRALKEIRPRLESQEPLTVDDMHLWIEAICSGMEILTDLGAMIHVSRGDPKTYGTRMCRVKSGTVRTAFRVILEGKENEAVDGIFNFHSMSDLENLTASDIDLLNRVRNSVQLTMTPKLRLIARVFERYENLFHSHKHSPWCALPNLSQTDHGYALGSIDDHHAVVNKGDGVSLTPVSIHMWTVLAAAIEYSYQLTQIALNNMRFRIEMGGIQTPPVLFLGISDEDSKAVNEISERALRGRHRASINIQLNIEGPLDENSWMSNQETLLSRLMS